MNRQPIREGTPSIDRRTREVTRSVPIQNDDGDDEQVRSLVLSLVDVSVAGLLGRDRLSEEITAAELPAALYSPLIEALTDRGITIVETDRTEADAEDDLESAPDSPPIAVWDSGWNADAFDHFAKKNWHELLEPWREHELLVRVEKGRLAREALKMPEVPDEVASDLRRRIASGRQAEEELVRHNLRLILKIASEHRRAVGPALELEDLFQEGFLGFIHALSKFEPHRGTRLSTYATWWVRQAVTRAVDNHRRAIRLPVHQWERIRALRNVEDRLRNRHGPSLEDAVVDELLAEEMSLTITEVRELRDLARPLISMDHPMRKSSFHLSEVVPDPQGSDPADVVADGLLKEEIAVLLTDLSEREQLVMIQRYGLDGEAPRTLEQVGELIGLTRERIRQIEAATLTKLRKSARLSRLEPYVKFPHELDRIRTQDQERHEDLTRRRREREFARAFGTSGERQGKLI